LKGNGLQKKEFKDDYVSIRDRIIPAVKFVKQSKHELFVTHYLHDPVEIKMLSTAWVTYPVSRQYHLPATISGSLDRGSTERLVKLYKDIMARREEIHTPLSRTASLLGKRGFEGSDSGSVKSMRLEGTTTKQRVEDPSQFKDLHIHDKYPLTEVKSQEYQDVVERGLAKTSNLLLSIAALAPAIASGTKSGPATDSTPREPSNQEEAAIANEIESGGGHTFTKEDDDDDILRNE